MLAAEEIPAAAAALWPLIRVASTLSTRVEASKGSQYRRTAGPKGRMGREEGRHAAGDSESARGGWHL